jgi:hypothetical protein
MAKAPNALLGLALRRLPELLEGLRQRGYTGEGHVFAFFNASVPPGIGVLTAEIQSSTGLSQSEARARAEAQNVDAAAIGAPLVVAGAFEPEELVVLLGDLLGRSAKALDEMRGWLRRKEGHVRVVLIDGQVVTRHTVPARAMTPGALAVRPPKAEKPN